MSKSDKKRVINYLVFGLILGAVIVFIWKSSASVESFLNSIESLFLSSAAIFTSLWTYRTFGRTELREEVQKFIEALDEFERTVADIVYQVPLLESLSESSQMDNSTWLEQIEEIKSRKLVAANKLRKLFDTSTHIPDKIRINLFLHGGFFFDNINKENHKDFQSKIFHLKEKLRRSVNQIF